MTPDEIVEAASRHLAAGERITDSLAMAAPEDTARLAALMAAHAAMAGAHLGMLAALYPPLPPAQLAGRLTSPPPQAAPRATCGRVFAHAPHPVLLPQGLADCDGTLR